MDSFTHKTLQTKPFNLTYSYYTSPDFSNRVSSSNTPVLLLLHGYPDYAHMWEGAMDTLSALPYPMIVPDLLGFDGSSKPTDALMYRYKQQADSLAQILDQEGVRNNVVPIGHDWGSGTAQRFYLYHRERCVGLGLISLAYQVPSPKQFDLDTANKTTAGQFGYPQWEYWNFFTADDAPALMKQNVSRFYDVNHGNYPSDQAGENKRDIWMREMFCVPGNMRSYVEGNGKFSNYTVPMKDYEIPQDKVRAAFIKRMERDGFEGPVQYYLSLKDNHNLEDERKAFFSQTQASDSTNPTLIIDVPLLYLGCTGDWVCRTDLMEGPQKAGLTPDLETQVIEGGHWILYERPSEAARLIKDWLVRRFPT